VKKNLLFHNMIYSEEHCLPKIAIK
jgi:hypothetical protein